MARPKLNIDPILVEKLGNIQCTNEEIAAVCNCSPDTIEKRFSGMLRKAREKGKMSLRRRLYEKSESNPAILIWLSKQYLGMREPQNDVTDGWKVPKEEYKPPLSLAKKPA